MREERRAVTVLSTDLVGSTPLSERLDPEEVKLIVGALIAHFVRIIEGLGGTVKDVAGDGVLALFGAPMAHEDDAERAVRAGLKIVEEAQRHGAEVAAAYGVAGPAVRVGVHTGPVVLGHQSVGGSDHPAAYGDTLNTAARIQAAAPPNTLLAGASTRRLIEPLFEWGISHTLSVKGKAAPVSMHEVRSARDVTGKVRGLEGASATFVGRDRELADAHTALRDVLTGSGGILLITGDPGIGKSRLAAEARALYLNATSDRGEPRWLEGRCVSYGDSLPYWPYRDLLREWLGVGAHDPELRARVALRRHVERLFPDRPMEIYPYLGALLSLPLEPEAAARLSPLSPEALQYQTFEVISALFERLAADGPVVLAIEDLHWADPTSVQLTEGLLRLAETAAVLLVVTLRPERDHPVWRLKEVAARDYPHRLREIALESLPPQTDQEMLASLIGLNTLPRSVEELVLARAEGNPFFLEELVRTLVDSGALVREEAGWRFDHEIPVEIPQTVEKVILSRIDRLPPASREVLTAASVLGRRFSLPHLEGVAGGNGTVEDALLDLQRVDLVRPGRRWPEPEYRFKHALIQEAAYRTIVTNQRTDLHRKAAEWLERRYTGREGEVTGVLAHHWMAAADQDKAIAYLTRAGDKARLEYALDEAVSHYRVLLPLLERRGERQAMALVLLKLALALHTSLRFGEANAVYQQAFEYWAPPPAWPGPATATLRVAQGVIPFDPDPSMSYQLPNIQACMAMYDRLVERWPEATIVPSLAERWEIADDGLTYRFYLRRGLLWSDGVPLTAHDVAFGVKRVLNPDRPGDSAAIYFVLENAQDYFMRRHDDADRIGVHALDDHTVEFRLVAPAPYFLSVVNRPDCAPLPRHQIERDGDAWIDLERQVVSGAFRRSEWAPDRVVLDRRDEYDRPRSGNVARVEFTRVTPRSLADLYERDALDLADLRGMFPMEEIYPAAPHDAHPGPPAGLMYLVFDHNHPELSRIDLRRALAHAVDRESLAKILPPHLIVATGGVVPPTLQGHTPDIAPRFDPDRARAYLGRVEVRDPLAVTMISDTLSGPIIESILTRWEDVLHLRFERRRITTAAAITQPAQGTPAPIFSSAWFPGYPDPEYFLRLLLHSEAKDNAGGFRCDPFDRLIEQARRETNDRARLELYHQADRMAVADQVAVLPLVYTSNVAFVKPRVSGWWEFGKSWASFADLIVEPSASRE